MLSDMISSIQTNTEQITRQLKEQISQSIDLSKNISDEEVRTKINDIVLSFVRQQMLPLETGVRLANQIFNTMRRLDILQPALEDPSITEIMVNGPDDIFIERNGVLSRLNVRFESRERLEDVIQAIVSRINRTVNEANPIVDARLPDGSRVHAVLPPIALNGPILTIRKFPAKPLSMNELVKMGSITEDAANFLYKAVQKRLNIFVCGGTGSGKTTFLNALSEFISPDERVITIEDSAELQLNIENLVRLETRNPNTENKGEITVRQLIKAALRMRPDRIIVGEVRGEEALDMLQAMNTGHDGSLSTGHANSCRDMLSRLETMVLCGASIPLEAIRQQIASALDLIVFLGRLRDGSRKVLEITELKEYAGGKYILKPLYRFEQNVLMKCG